MKTRTSQQNNALHLYLSRVAKELANQGYTMRDVIESIKKVEIMPTGNALKEIVWRPIQKILFGKTSTTELSKSEEIDKIYDVMNLWLAREFDGLHIPFPTQEELEKVDDTFIPN